MKTPRLTAASGPRSHHWEVTLQPEGLQLIAVPSRDVDVANKGQRDPSWVCACPKEASGPVGLGAIDSCGVGYSSPPLLAKAAPMDNLYMTPTS